MSLFKKKRNVPLPEPRTETPSKEMTEVHASPPAPDAAAVIGGLDWYRAQFHRAMKLALALTVALCASLGVAAILLLNQPKPQYFAATPDLRLAPMIPLDQPLLTQEGLLTWEDLFSYPPFVGFFNNFTAAYQEIEDDFKA